MPAPGGDRARLEGRRRAGERTEPGPDRGEAGLVEAGAHLRDVDEARRVRRPVVEAEVQRPEVPARALGIGVAADHELLPLLALDLDPVAGAPAGIGALRLLGHDPFEPLGGGRLEERDTLPGDVVAVAHRPERRHEEPQALLALDEGPAAQVAIVEHEAVEEDAHRGPALRGHRDLARVGERHAGLQALEARPARVVQRHDLAVDHEAVDGQRSQGAHHLGIPRGRILAAPSVQGHALAPAVRQHAHPVVLDLVDPGRIGEGPLRERGQGEGLGARVHLGARRPQRVEAGAHRGEPGRAVGHLLDGETGEHRLRVALDQLDAVGRQRGAVGLLEQQPVAVLARHAREGPAPAHLVAEDLHLELAARELIERLLRLARAVPAVVPHDDRARSVVAGGDDALEVAVLDRVILDVHREPLLLRVPRRSLGHRPALEHAVHLEAQVVVQAPRGVLLHHEEAPARGRVPSEGLGGAIRIALLAVGFERRRTLAAERIRHNPSPLRGGLTPIRCGRHRRLGA